MLWFIRICFFVIILYNRCGTDCFAIGMVNKAVLCGNFIIVKLGKESSVLQKRNRNCFCQCLSIFKSNLHYDDIFPEFLRQSSNRAACIVGQFPNGGIGNPVNQEIIVFAFVLSIGNRKVLSQAKFVTLFRPVHKIDPLIFAGKTDSRNVFSRKIEHQRMPCHFAAVADRTCVDDCTGLRNFLVRPMCIGSYNHTAKGRENTNTSSEYA